MNGIVDIENSKQSLLRWV